MELGVQSSGLFGCIKYTTHPLHIWITILEMIPSIQLDWRLYIGFRKVFEMSANFSALFFFQPFRKAKSDNTLH
jgi:hypothetical protein